MMTCFLSILIKKNSQRERYYLLKWATSGPSFTFDNILHKHWWSRYRFVSRSYFNKCILCHLEKLHKWSVNILKNAGAVCPVFVIDKVLGVSCRFSTGKSFKIEKVDALQEKIASNEFNTFFLNKIKDDFLR